MVLPTIFRPAILLLPVFAATAMGQTAPQAITVKTLQAQMRYSLTDLQAQPGQPLKITFENTDDMPHNMVFCKPGTDVVAMAAKELEKPEEALKRNFLPDDPAIWMHSRLLQPKESEELAFNAPKEPGDYPYVCTMPGHASSMRGVLRVLASGAGLEALKFKLYLGAWTRLPDFSKLTPHREGDVPDGLVQLNFDDYKNNYGLVFDGKLTAPKAGDYTFALASDDGSRLQVDGKKVVDADGIHPSESIHEGKVHLEPGAHTVRIEYFQAGGESALYAGWKGPSFSITPLSKWQPGGWNGKPAEKRDDHTGMPIVVGKEAVIYRNFIEGGGDRGIAVGYPGGVNIVWNAENMNLAEFWRGAFIDAARHWTDRGGGQQPPLGYDVVQPVDGLTVPFMVSSAEDAPWPKINAGHRAEGFKWKGYRLDDSIPTFFYEWNGLKVSDRFDVEGTAASGNPKLIRTLKLEGAIPAGALFRAAAGQSIEPQGGGFLVKAARFNQAGRDFENQFSVSAEGARVAGHSLIIPAKAEMKVTYSWPGDHSLHAGLH